MQLQHILLEIKGEYKVYVDMDGVLVDFVKGYETLTDTTLGAPKVGKERSEFWKQFKVSLNQKGITERDFWGNLNWLSDGKQLWNYVTPHSPTILSSPTTSPESKTGKLDWIKKHIGSVPTILAYDKGKHAHLNGVLIDDRKDFIDKWENGGGIGILHTSTSDTIQQLKKLGI